MKPACAIEEYASRRFMSVCVTESTEPTTIVSRATRTSALVHSQRAGVETDVGQAQDRAERGSLGARGHEAGDRRRGALVDVGRPCVERHRTDLEEQADEDEERARDEQAVHRQRTGGDRLAEVAEVDRAGVAVEQGRAEEEERRAERAEQEVLERRLLREQAAAAGEAREDVERQREHLERDEHADEVVRRREEHHAEDREHRQREDLGRQRTRAGRRRLGRRARRRRTARGERVGADAAEAARPWSGRRAHP